MQADAVVLQPHQLQLGGEDLGIAVQSRTGRVTLGMGTLARVHRSARITAELAAAATVMVPTVAASAARAVFSSRSSRSAVPRLLTLEADYSLATIRTRGLEELITARDIGGFFDHVWSVHPSVGADAAAEQLAEPPTGPPVYTAVSPKHTMVEGRVGRFRQLAGFPMLNFALSQRALLKELGRLIRRERINVIRASDPFYLAPLGLILARSNHIPLVVRLTGNYDMSFFADGRPVYPRLFGSRAIEQRVGRFMLHHADLVAAGNDDIRDYAVSNGARPERTTVFLVGNLIEPVHFRTDPSSRPRVNGELGLGDRPFIVCVSRLEKLKHPEDFVAVLAEVRSAAPRLAGVLIGDGSMRDELEALARRLGIEDDLIFAGNREQPWIANALSSADVVVSPLTGRSLVEAALSGTPIVAYNTDWQSEVVKDGSTGILVPYRDTHKMAVGVCNLLKDKEYAGRLGTTARMYTLTLMDPQRLDRHERREYERLMGKPPAGYGRRRSVPVAHRPPAVERLYRLISRSRSVLIKGGGG